MSSDYLIQLIQSITQPADISSTSDETFKYPFIASHFFCIQFSKLTEKILENRELFELLLNFLNQSDPLPVLAGYFSKACNNLLETNTDKFLYEFFKKDGHLKLVQNLQNSALADLLGQILVKTCKYDDFFEEIHETLTTLGKNLVEEDEMFCFNAGNVLRRLGDYKNIEISGFWVKLMSKNFQSEPSAIIYKSFLKSNRSFIDSLIKGVQSKKFFFRSTCLKVLLDIFLIVDLDNVEEVNWVTKIFSDDLESFVDILQEKSMSQEFLSVLEIVKCLISIGDQEICEKLADLRVFRRILDCLELFPFCNFLHNLVSSIFCSILNSNLFSIKKHLLKELEILDFIIFHTQHPMVAMKRGQARKGFIPHLFLLANLLQGLKKSEIFILGLLKEHKTWKKFTRSTLLIQNCIESKSLGGENMENFFEKSSSSDEVGVKMNENIGTSDNEFNDLEFWKLPITIPQTLEEL